MEEFNITKLALNISSMLIKDPKSTAEFWVNDSLDYNHAINIVNKFHSYFHFEQSNICLQAAKIFQSLGDRKSQEKYLIQAIFQDHINYEALSEIHKFPGYEDIYPKTSSSDKYNSHIHLESQYLKFAIGEFNHNIQIAKLDEAIILLEDGDVTCAKNVLKNIESYCFSDKAIDVLKWEMVLSLHRYFLLKAKICYAENDPKEALTNILKSLTMVEKSHKDYHHQAAIIYLKRSQYFKEQGEETLAKNDVIKALDLYPHILG